MRALTTSAHLEPDTGLRVNVFSSFVSLRIGTGLIDIVLMANVGTSEVLRSLAKAAEEAACLLDDIADGTGEVPR
ncbi:hypothetical protein ACFWY6_06760 [Streptomyces sp. NPDC059037]|uniref:hypothetical protein n=1 Tax=Streptomyces sp. NPDC059037 TaxID=3346710 RepID=UPI0036D10B7A